MISMFDDPERAMALAVELSLADWAKLVLVTTKQRRTPQNPISRLPNGLQSAAESKRRVKDLMFSSRDFI